MTTPTSYHRAPRLVLRDESGATAVEYGLIIALIAVAIMVTVTVLGQRVNGALAQVSDSIAGTTQQGGGNNGGGNSGSNGGGNGQGNSGNGNGNGGSNGSWGGGGSGAGGASASAGGGSGNGGKGGK